MTFSLVIELGGTAVAKGRHRSRIQSGSGGRVFAQQYPDGKTVKYESQLRVAGQYAMQDQMPGTEPTRKPCRVIVDVYMQAPQTPQGGKAMRAAMLAGTMRPTKKPDVDNYLKTVGDALNGIVWVDDSGIAEATVRKWWAEHARLVVTVDTIEPAGRRAQSPDLLSEAAA